MIKCKAPFLGIFVVTMLFGFSAFAQVCNKGPVIYFNSSNSNLSNTEKSKLDSLTKMIGSNGEAYIELGGHADTKGKESYNEWLSGVRVNSVKSYILKNSGKGVEIKSYNFGESRPLVKDTTDALRALNRRVEVFYFPMKDGKVVMKDKNGASIVIDKNDFSACGMCVATASSKVMKGNIIGSFLSAEDDSKLVVAGEVQLDRDCKQTASPCTNASVRIPGEYDSEMSIWKSSGSGNATKWAKTKDKLTYDPAHAEYVMDVQLCNKSSYIIAKAASKTDVIKVTVPALSRDNDMKPYVLKDENGYMNPPVPNEYGETEEILPEDINMLEVKSSTDTSLTTQCEDCKNYVMLSDTGLADNGYNYYYNGPLQPAYQGTEKRTSTYALTMSDYRPIVRFKDSTMVLKIPKKYANLVKLYLPGIDSSLNVRRYNDKSNQFKSQIPAHPWKVTFRESRLNKFAVDEKQLCLKYKKRKNIFKAKIKKSYLQPQK